jgi:hypothetical protein
MSIWCYIESECKYNGRKMMKFLGQTRQSGTERLVLSPLGNVTTDLWLFETGPAQMKAISRVEAGLCYDRFFCALDFSIHTLHSYLFVYEDQVFVYLGQYSFLSISLLILLFPPPPPSLFTLGCIIYSIT